MGEDNGNVRACPAARQMLDNFSAAGQLEAFRPPARALFVGPRCDRCCLAACLKSTVRAHILVISSATPYSLSATHAHVPPIVR